MLNRKLIGLLALLLSAGLTLSACGDDEETGGGDSNNPSTNNPTPDAGGTDDTGGVEEDATGDTGGQGDTTEPETGCTEGSCAEGYECNTTDSVCEPIPTGCDSDTPPDRCSENPANAEFGPSSYVTDFRVSGEQGDPACCFDLNGDGVPDNALSVLNTFDVNDGIQGSVDSGSLVLLFEHEGLDDLVDSSPYTLNVWLGESVEPPVTGPFVVDPTSIDEGTQPQASLPNAKIEGGVLTAGPGIVDINVALEGILDAPLGLRISQAQIEATVDPSSTLEDGVAIAETNPALYGGKLGGAVRVDDLVKAVNEFGSTCDCLGLNGGDVIALDGMAASCNPTPDSTCEAGSTCETLTSALVCQTALPVLTGQVDVDTDGDGADDALSIGTLFNTEAATISGFGTAE